MKKGDINWFVMLWVVVIFAAGIVIYITYSQLTAGSESFSEINFQATKDTDSDGTFDLFDKCPCEPKGEDEHPSFKGCPNDPNLDATKVAEKQKECKKSLAEESNQG